ncbi:hypothetical protein N431DRAFT_547637 [Stipitochalara longipes BDJ]|nr:hypothetical protein N431DRAFT_547637 [Stipitochalara longipes BDJ]
MCGDPEVTNDATSPLPPFFGLPRELRDTIYFLHIEYQLSDSVYSRVVFERKRCSGCRENELAYWTARKPTFPMLFFTLHFFCTCHLLSFLQKPRLYRIQQELTSLNFHWRGEINGNPPIPQDALGRLQTLPALTHLTIRITNSLPLSERANFLVRSGFKHLSRDFCFLVADAIGFDELCSVRGLKDISLDVDFFVGSVHAWDGDVRHLKTYLEANLKLEKPPGYDKKPNIPTPYRPRNRQPGMEWSGGEDTSESTLEGRLILGY